MEMWEFWWVPVPVGFLLYLFYLQARNNKDDGGGKVFVDQRGGSSGAGSSIETGVPLPPGLGIIIFIILALATVVIVLS